MFFRFDNSSARVEGALLMAGLPPRDVHHVMKRQGSFVDGWGRCKSCDCLSAPLRFALLRLTFSLSPRRVIPLKSAPRRSAPLRSAPLRSIAARIGPFRQAFHSATPCWSNTTWF